MTITINKEKIRHLLTLAGAVAIPLLTVWQDAASVLAEKIAISLGVIVSLFFDPATRGKIANYVLGVVGVLTPVITIIISHGSSAAKGGAIVSTLLAVLSNLNKIFKPQATVQPDVAIVGELKETLKKN